MPVIQLCFTTPEVDLHINFFFIHESLIYVKIKFELLIGSENIIYLLLLEEQQFKMITEAKKVLTKRCLSKLNNAAPISILMESEKLHFPLVQNVLISG